MTEISHAPRALALIDFWFGPLGSPDRERPRDNWFSTDPDFDAALRERFLGDHEAASAGQCEAWRETPQTCLALILLFDQIPRNLFRGSPRAFVTDALARGCARHAVAHGFDRVLPIVWRWFVYLPFEHSEDLGDQEWSVTLFGALPAEAAGDTLDYARRHRDIIARFGRFPHRNRILGRASSAAEEAFLREPNSAF